MLLDQAQIKLAREVVGFILAEKPLFALEKIQCDTIEVLLIQSSYTCNYF